MQTEAVTSSSRTGPAMEANDELADLTRALGSLFNELTQTDGAVADAAGEVIRIAREVGTENLVRPVREGSEEAMQLLGSLYMLMRQAAARGVGQAGELTATIARKLEEAGYTIELDDRGHDCGCEE
jgi:hypothetical protein